ncbi:hypothetical protein HZA40_00630 [Candidatus Peregrinibacteria bacterium]|nr:hypothetical protein [Candidatus Peregrinibacteria bacterium]
MSLIDYELKHGKIHTKETLKSETKRTIRMLVITLGTMIFVLSIAFLFISNSGAQKGNILQKLKSENKDLKNENIDLTTKVTDSNSFTNLQDNKQIFEMQKIETKNYVTPEDNKIRK